MFQLSIESFFSNWNLLGLVFTGSILSAFWFSDFQPASQIKLRLKYSRVSQANISESFLTPPINHFQKLLKHIGLYINHKAFIPGTTIHLSYFLQCWNRIPPTSKRRQLIGSQLLSIVSQFQDRNSLAE